MKNKARLIKWVLNTLESKRQKCNHMFRTSDVVDMDIDPECVYCGLRLSEVNGVNLQKK